MSKLKVYTIEFGGYIFVTPSGKVYCFDTSYEMQGRYAFVSFIKTYLKKDEIEAIFISHYHSNHTGGASHIIEAFKGRVNKVYSSGVRSTGTNNGYDDDVEKQEKMELMIRHYNIPHEYVKKGDVITDGDVVIDIVAPTIQYFLPDTLTDDPNGSNQMLISLSYGDFSFFFTADMRPKQYNDIKPIKATIVTAPHHGHTLADFNDDMLDNINPETVIIESVNDTLVNHLRGKEVGVLWLSEGRNVIEGNHDGSYTVRKTPRYSPLPRMSGLIM